MIGLVNSWAWQTMSGGAGGLSNTAIVKACDSTVISYFSSI